MKEQVLANVLAVIGMVLLVGGLTLLAECEPEFV